MKASSSVGSSGAITHTPGFCALCKSHCGSIMVTQNGKFIAQEPNPAHPTGKALCVKGKAAPELIYNSQRLLYPMMRTRPKGDPDPGWKRISWSEALDRTAEAMNRIREESGAEAVAFSTATPSGTAISDDIRWIERLSNVFGSPNVVNGFEICNWHKDFAHAYTYGRGISSPDFIHSNCILLWGHNPSATWLDHATAVSAAKARGARIIVVDPRRAGFAAGADQWLRVRPGADGALALGISRAMISNGWFDHEFVHNHTNGPLLVRMDTGKFLRVSELRTPPADSDALDLVASTPSQTLLSYNKKSHSYHGGEDLALSAELDVELAKGGKVKCKSAFTLFWRLCEEYTPEHVEKICWVPSSQVIETARLLHESGPVSYYWWSGVGQHTNATQTDRAISTMMALTGNFDCEGGNVAFGKPKVNSVSGAEFMPEAQLAKCVGLKRSSLGPARKGWIGSDLLYEAVLEKKPYQIRALIGFGRNLLLNHADAKHGIKALCALEFYAHADLTLTPTANYADIVFPINTPWERQSLRVGFEGSAAAECLVQLRQAAIASEGESRQDAFIVFELAKRLGHAEQFWNGDIDAGLEYILKPLNINLTDLKNSPNGISIPSTTRYKSYVENGFKTDTGKIELYSELFLNNGFNPLPVFVEPAVSPISQGDGEFPLVLTTSKIVLYRHSQDRQVVSLRQRNPDPEINLHPQTAEERNISEGDWVYVQSPHGKIKMHAKFDVNLDPRVVWAQYGWWQPNEKMGLEGYDPLTEEGSNFSLLISDQVTDPMSGSLALRSYICNIYPVNTKSEKAWIGWRPFRVTSTTLEAKDIMSFKLAPVDGKPLSEFMGGQHVTIRTGPKDTQYVRCYSLSGPPEPSAYRITVKLADRSDASTGKMSGFLHAYSSTPDFTIELMAPKGDFHLASLVEDHTAPIIMIAGGIGITPLLSMLYHFHRAGWKNRIELFYGISSSAEHAFAKELEALQKKIPQLNVKTFYSTANTNHDNTNIYTAGRISMSHITQSTNFRDARFVLCGPPRMVSAIMEGLADLGIKNNRVFLEAFGPSSKQASVIHSKSQPISLARSGKSLEWEPGAASLLELVELSGTKVSSGCRVGQCESCLVKLVAGEVAYPEGVETPQPGTCLLCVGVPLSPLILDV